MHTTGFAHRPQLLPPLKKVVPLVVRSIKNPLASPKMQILCPEILNPFMNKFPSTIQRPPPLQVFLGLRADPLGCCEVSLSEEG